MEPIKITVETSVRAPMDKVWTAWTEPEHINQWSTASADWETVNAQNDLKVGGTFSSRMQAKDGSTGFDFGGTYDAVVPEKLIAYTMGDGRKVEITFTQDGETVKISETFDAETENTVEMQKSGWQAIMDNFKRHVETA